MTNHAGMAMTLKPKPNYPNGSIQKRQIRKKHIKFGQMWLFSSITMAQWCIMKCCYNVLLSIRNTILKLCAQFAKQFVRNAQICGKIQTWILHHDNAPAKTSMLVQEFLVKTKTVITVFTGLGPRWHFLFPILKTPMEGKHFAMIEKIKEKSMQ